MYFTFIIVYGYQHVYGHVIFECQYYMVGTCTVNIMETEKPYKEGHLLFPPHGVLGQLKVSFIIVFF